MKQTNERAVIQLVHKPSGEYVDWLISEEAKPSVIFIGNSIGNLRDELMPLLERMDSDDEKLSLQEYKRIDELHDQIRSLRLDQLEIIMMPKEGIPEDYDSLRDYLNACLQGLEVINAIVDFFWKHSGNSTELPGDSLPPIRILDRNGEEWESPITKALRESKNSTG